MKTWLKVLFGLFIIGFIAAFLIYKYVYNKPHPDFEKMKPDYSLSSQELYNAFTSNRGDAEKKFNGKVVELKGTPTKTEVTDSLVIAVFVFNKGIFGDEGVRCTMLPKYNEEAKKLKTSGPVTIKGYCTGFSDTDVILEQCCIIK